MVRSQNELPGGVPCADHHQRSVSPLGESSTQSVMSSSQRDSSPAGQLFPHCAPEANSQFDGCFDNNKESYRRTVRTQAKLLYAQCRALLQNRYDSGLLITSAALVVAVTVVEYVYLAFAPLPSGCPSRQFSRGTGTGVPRGCESLYRVSVLLTIARFAVCGGCLGGLWLQRAIHNHATASGRTPGVARSEEAPAAIDKSFRRARRMSDLRVWGSGTTGWAVASSKQAWLEVSGAMYSSVTLMLGTTLVQGLILAGFNLITALTNDGWTRGASWDYACRTCSDAGGTGETRDSAVSMCMASGRTPLNLCFLSWHGRVILPLLVTGQVISLGILTSFGVVATWDPVAVKAGRRTGLEWLDRVRVMHFALAPSMAHIGFPLLAIESMELNVTPRKMVEAAGLSSIIFIIVQAGLTFWVLQKGHRQQQQKCTVSAFTGTVDEEYGSSENSSVGVDIASRSTANVVAFSSSRRWRVWSLARAFYNSFLMESASMHLKRMFILVLILWTFSAADVSYGAAYRVAVLILRVAWLAVFIFMRDTPASFSDLKRDPNGAGFGLVVDACLLREALQRHMNDDTAKNYDRSALPTYKATLYRMEATMAVSYRWQDKEALVCPGLKLNMTRWQMGQLVRALGSTSCFYVWIDRLSVPQYECELQNTLLSRMMATYASARETLVLRSAEEVGSRYHQRAWTLPEFVCSISLRICTELPSSYGPCEGPGSKEAFAWADTDPRTSVTTAEERQVDEIRQHYVEYLPRCLPLWLHPDDGQVRFACEVLQAWDTCARAWDSLNCSVPEDRIRAVYPLIFCVPVENHEELVSLVDAVASALEREAPGSAPSATARRHYHQIVGAAVIDPDEIATVDSVRSSRHPPRGGFLGSALSSAASIYTATSVGAATAFRSALASARMAIPLGFINPRDSVACEEGAYASMTMDDEPAHVPRVPNFVLPNVDSADGSAQLVKFARTRTE